MAQYIEFLGPAGSGKTTAYRALRKSLKRNWASFRIIEDRTLEILSDDVRPLERLLFRLGLKRQARAWLKLLPANIRDTKYQAFADFCDSHRDFSALLFEDASTRISPTDRTELPLLGWILELVWSYHLSQSKPGMLRLLLREHGFSQMGLSLIAYRLDKSEQYADELTRRYYSTMALPDIAIVMKTNADMILERLTSRGFPERMSEMSETQKRASIMRAITTTENASQILAARGTRILTLPNSESREQLVSRMPEIAKQIDQPSQRAYDAPIGRQNRLIWRK